MCVDDDLLYKPSERCCCCTGKHINLSCRLLSLIRLVPRSECGSSLADTVSLTMHLEHMLLLNLVYISNRCGKTTVCQMFSALANQKLYSVNCHLNMETSDFLGGLRPVRQKPNDKVGLDTGYLQISVTFFDPCFLRIMCFTSDI
jgi:hypothetical protein